MYLDSMFETDSWCTLDFYYESSKKTDEKKNDEFWEIEQRKRLLEHTCGSKEIKILNTNKRIMKRRNPKFLGEISTRDIVFFIISQSM